MSSATDYWRAFEDELRQVETSIRIDRIRREIEAGTYETDEKHDVAAERMLDDVMSEMVK